MKQRFSLKRTGTVIIGVLLLFSFAATAYAADASATYNGSYAGTLFGFAPDDNSGTGLFPNFQNMMPGETYTQKVTVSNASYERIELFLKGEPVNESKAGLFDKVTMEIRKQDGTLLVSERVSSAWPQNGVTTNAGTFLHLGRFYAGDVETLTVTMKLPADLNNDYMDAVGKVNWVFQADVYVPYDGGDDDDGPRIPLGPGATITINENTIPLSPGTGDHANLLLWGGLFVVFAILLAVLLYKRRKQHAS